MNFTLEPQPELRLDYMHPASHGIQAQLALEKTLEKSNLGKPLMELVRLRASQVNGCAFCVDMHFSEAHQGGETERRLNAVLAWRETPLFTARERAALAWTEAVTLVADSHVPDELWQSIRPLFTEAELVDLTLLIGSINTWNRFAISFRTMPRIEGATEVAAVRGELKPEVVA